MSDRYPYALQEETIAVLNKLYGFPRPWSLHWNAMFHSACQGCSRYVRPGDRYYHNPAGMSFHEVCAHNLLKEQQEAERGA